MEMEMELFCSMYRSRYAVAVLVGPYRAIRYTLHSMKSRGLDPFLQILF
jgi:hypothetical protein